jgi:DNA-binding MarR family transcriptional regulator
MAGPKEVKAKRLQAVARTPVGFAPQKAEQRGSSAWQQLEALSGRGERGSSAQLELLALARATLRARRIRNQHLPSSMFGEPGWEMLLWLYIVDNSGARQTVSRLCKASGAPATTAMRWIDYLEKQKYVTRGESPTDRRIVYLDLTASGREAVESYFASLQAAGLPTLA